MRRFRGNYRALSEIVGTLMLILIVVAAATALSVFVTSYEKTVLSQEANSHEKSLESYTIFGTNISDSWVGGVSGGEVPAYYVFDIASTTVETSAVTSILINDQPALWYCVLPVTAVATPSSSCTGSPTSIPAVPNGLGGSWISYGNATNFTAHSEYQIVVNYDDPNGFLNPCGYNSFGQTNPPGAMCSSSGSTPPSVDFAGTPIGTNGFLRIELYTLYDNEFTQTWAPPIAIANVSTISVPGTSSVVTALDGEASIQTGGNDSILDWDWVVSTCPTPGTITGCSASDLPSLPVAYSGSGEAVEVPSPSAIGGIDSDCATSNWPAYTCTYAVTLTVVNGVGLLDSVTIYWTVPPAPG